MLLSLQKRPGSPKQHNDKSNAKPPLPNHSAAQLRKGAYHESLDFVLLLCETSYGLVDVFPIEDCKSALREVNTFELCVYQLLFTFWHNLQVMCLHLAVLSFNNVVLDLF